MRSLKVLMISQPVKNTQNFGTGLHKKTGVKIVLFDHLTQNNSVELRIIKMFHFGLVCSLHGCFYKQTTRAQPEVLGR